jgi:MFS family permease
VLVDTPPQARHRRTRRVATLLRSAGFWLVGATVLVVLAAASAPSPLYVVYQERWHFSELVLTTVFASYAVALLVALVTVGGISDFVGRRPVLLVALTLEAVSMGLFVLAAGSHGGLMTLVLARVVQGLATGALTGCASAALVDLQPGGTLGALVNSVGATSGLALGALLSGLMVQLVPDATTWVFVVLLAAVVALAVTVLRLPETVGRRPGALASLRPRLGVPPQARGAFLVALPILVATWSMGALYLSLGPSVAIGVLHASGHLVGALLVTTFAGAGAVGGVLVRNRRPSAAMVAGAATLAFGVSLSVVTLDAGSSTGFFLGTAVGGLGFGAGFLGAFRTLVTLAEPHQRAELLASVYVVSYLSFSIPAVVAGLVVPRLGLRSTTNWYAAVVVVLALTVVLLAGSQALLVSRGRRRATCPG